MKFFSRRLLRMTKKWVIPAAGILALIIFSSIIIFEATKATVDVTQDGETTTVQTHAKTVGDLMDELDLVIGEHDDLSHELDDLIVDGAEIHHKEAQQVYVTIDDNKTDYYTTTDTVSEFLTEAGLNFSDHDEVSFKEDDTIVAGLNMTVTQAYQVTIDDAGEKTKVWTTGGLVSDLLDEHEVSLTKIDKVSPKIDKPLQEDTLIKITRVEKKSDQVEETLAFKTETREDNSLEKGQEKVISNGKKGKLVKTFEITKENGKEVERKLVKEEVKEKQQNKVVAVGTKEVPKQNLVTVASKNKNQASTKTNTQQKQSDGNLTTTAKKTESASKPAQSASSSEPAGKEMTMSATAYTAGCQGCSGITATGINLNANPNMKVIAVDPSVIPLGSTVWVEGYGTAIAGDTGGAIKGNRIDIHVPTRADALQFGRRTVKVKIIK